MYKEWRRSTKCEWPGGLTRDHTPRTAFRTPSSEGEHVRNTSATVTYLFSEAEPWTFQGGGTVSSESIRKAFCKRNLVLAFAALTLLGAVLVQTGFGSYSSTLSDEETVSVTSKYVNLSQTLYTNTTLFSTDEVTTGYYGFTYEVESSAGADDTVILVTVADRSTLSSFGAVKFWVASAYSGAVHHAEVVLTLTSTADSIPTVAVDVDGTAGGSIGAKADPGSGSYQFKIQVNGMYSQSTASVTAGATEYVLNKSVDVGTISGTAYAGKAFVTSVITADHSTQTSSMKLRVSTTGFADLGDSGWMYILKLTGSGSTQYAYSTDGENWTYASGGALTVAENSQYAAAFYLAGVKSGSDATAWADVPGTDGAVVTDSVIEFTHDSTW